MQRSVSVQAIRSLQSKFQTTCPSRWTGIHERLTPSTLIRISCYTKKHFSTSRTLRAKKRNPRTHALNTYQQPVSRTTTPVGGTTPKKDDPSTRSPFPFFWTLSAVAFAASISFVTVLFLRDPPTPDSTASASAHAIPQDVSDRYHQTAATFDSDVAFFESMSGLNRLRRRLVRRASGHVLEVAAGTGRNLRFYDFRAVRTLTLLDQAGEMVDVARRKAAATLPQAQAADRVRYLTQSALDPLAAPLPPEGGFDAVVQTMGLCSTGEPVAYLRHLATLVKRDTGVILLLEHGRGHYAWLNRALDRWAPAHADRHGCWWNRDIGAIVEESGLEVVRMKRHQLGTTWYVELKVGRELGGKLGGDKVAEGQSVEMKAESSRSSAS